MSMSAHQTTAATHDEWLTPREILCRLGEFDLDPCAPIVRPWPTATCHYTADDDGLSQPWHGRVWLNPPFSRDIGKWISRLANHGRGIALLAARTETAHWQNWVWPFASAVLFLRSRPHFHYVNGDRAPFNSGVPIALVSYSAADREVLIHSNLDGYVACGTFVKVFK